MIEDILASIADLFDRDATLMALVALALSVSALGFLAFRLAKARTDVARRVTGDADEGGSRGRQAATNPAQNIKARVGGLIGGLARSAGEDDAGGSSVLRARLVQAGFYDRQAVIWFFGARLAAALGLAAILALCDWLFRPAEPYAELAAAALTGVALGFVAPSIALDRRIERCKREHASGFPDFMDLMVVCAQAGLSMEAAINRIAKEIEVAFPSLARNLDLAAREIRSGKPLSKSIESLAVRLGIAEAASFSTLLQQSEELGSSLTQSLRAYSDDMRNKRMMKAEEKAYALPAKLVVPLTLFVFPTLLVVLLLPVVISVSGARI